MPISQTAPNVNFDEFLAGLDAETRAYLQELLAGRGRRLRQQRPRASRRPSSASSRRRGYGAGDPARTRQALGQHQPLDPQLPPDHAKRWATRDKQIAELVDSSNAVFQTFAKEDANFAADAAPAAGRAPQDRQSARQGRGRLRPGRPDAAQAQPVRQSARPGAAGDETAGDQRRRRSSRTKSAPSRGKSCRRSTNSVPPRRRSPNRSRSSRRASR